MMQSEARLTEEPQVDTDTRSGHIHSWKLIMESFQRSFSPFHCFKKGTCQYGLTAKPGQEYCG